MIETGPEVDPKILLQYQKGFKILDVVHLGPGSNLGE